MQKLKQAVKKFGRDEDGLTVVEYAVAGGLIAAGLVAAFVALGETVEGIIEYIDTQLQASPGAGG